MANPNIASLGTLNGVTTLVSSIATGTGSTLIAAVTTNHVYKLNSVTIANKTGSAATITVAITRSGTDYYLAYQISVPANASLNVLGKDMQIYLQESDVLKAIAGTGSALDAVCSYEDVY